MYAIVNTRLGRRNSTVGLIRGVYGTLKQAEVEIDRMDHNATMVGYNVKLKIYRLTNRDKTAGDWARTGDVEPL